MLNKCRNTMENAVNIFTEKLNQLSALGFKIDTNLNDLANAKKGSPTKINISYGEGTSNYIKYELSFSSTKTAEEWEEAFEEFLTMMPLGGIASLDQAVVEALIEELILKYLPDYSNVHAHFGQHTKAGQFLTVAANVDLEIVKDDLRIAGEYRYNAHMTIKEYARVVSKVSFALRLNANSI